MDDEVNQFMMVTGVDSEQVARGYLEISGGQAMQAIQTFFDNPELQSSFNNPPAVPPASSRPAPRNARGAGSARRVINLDSSDDDIPMTEDDDDDDDDDDGDSIAAIARNAQEEEDAAMARRLQEEMYGSGAGAGAVGDDGVRAPIAQTTEVLAGPNPSWPVGFDEDRAEEFLRSQARQARQRRQAANVSNSSNVFQQASMWDDPDVPSLPSHTRPARREPDSRAARLRDLFAPPRHLISPFTWDEARDEGKEEMKWILVNLQDMDIFHCQALNRDIWKNDDIQNLIKEHFIFLQYEKREPRAQSFIQFYFPNEAHENGDNYPHVSIIDPRTGEQVKTWAGHPFPKAAEFYSDLVEFLDRYSLAANSKNPVPKTKPKTQQVDVGRLTEEEMLQLAMQNSMETNGGSAGPSVHDPDSLTKSKGKGASTDQPIDLTEETESVEPNPADSMFGAISSSNPHVEPENNPATTTRIQFRHSGGRVIRRFSVSDPVRRLYEWLKAEPFDGKEGVPFELKTMPAGTDLIAQLDKTIEEAGLKQGTVMIEFVEED